MAHVRRRIMTHVRTGIWTPATWQPATWQPHDTYHGACKKAYNGTDVEAYDGTCKEAYHDTCKDGYRETYNVAGTRTRLPCCPARVNV